MKGKGKVAVMVMIGMGLLILAAAGTVRVSDTVIASTIINATPEEVLAWMGTEGEGFFINKDTKVVTYPWWPGYEETPIDGLTVGGGFTYTVEYAGVTFKGEGVVLGPVPTRPGVPSLVKFSGDDDSTFTQLIVPVKEGTKLIFVDEYSLDAPAGKKEKIKRDIEQHMANAVKIIKKGVEK